MSSGLSRGDQILAARVAFGHAVFFAQMAAKFQKKDVIDIASIQERINHRKIAARTLGGRVRTDYAADLATVSYFSVITSCFKGMVFFLGPKGIESFHNRLKSVKSSE